MAYEQACCLDPLRPGYRCWLRAAASTDSTMFSLSATRYRNYHPTLGRWIERDPEGYVDGMSLYQYCLSNPANGTDPMGLSFLGDAEAKGRYFFNTVSSVGSFAADRAKDALAFGATEAGRVGTFVCRCGKPKCRVHWG